MDHGSGGPSAPDTLSESEPDTKRVDGRVRRLVEQQDDVRVLIGERDLEGPSALHPVYNVSTKNSKHLETSLDHLHVGAVVSATLRQTDEDLQFEAVSVTDDFRLFINERPSTETLPTSTSEAWENRATQVGTTLGMAEVESDDSRAGWAVTLPGGDAAVPTVNSGELLQEGTPAAVDRDDVSGYDRWGDFLIGQWGEEFLAGLITGGNPREAIAANPQDKPFWVLYLFDAQGTPPAATIADQLDITEYSDP